MYRRATVVISASVSMSPSELNVLVKVSYDMGNALSGELSHVLCVDRSCWIGSFSPILFNQVSFVRNDLSH